MYEEINMRAGCAMQMLDVVRSGDDHGFDHYSYARTSGILSCNRVVRVTCLHTST